MGSKVKEPYDASKSTLKPIHIYTVPYSKMEKNYLAILEKGYSRDPAAYEEVLWMLKKAKGEEMDEITVAMRIFMNNPCRKSFMKAIEEISDVQNLMDYLAEYVTRIYIDGLIEKAAVDGLEKVFSKKGT
jgi:uncharacterized tellurite resistance protein B-like protein